jgi:hypothetical protein
VRAGALLESVVVQDEQRPGVELDALLAGNVANEIFNEVVILASRGWNPLPIAGDKVSHNNISHWRAEGQHDPGKNGNMPKECVCSCVHVVNLTF